MHELVLSSLTGVIGFSLGYAFRGFIRRDIQIAGAEAETLAKRLEQAVRSGAVTLQAEATKIASELRAKI